MSSGNTTTEYTRMELAIDEEMILRDSALVRNSVLRRALAIAAYERAQLEGHRFVDGTIYMLAWVMQASEEVEKERADGQW
jgi:hypothetical protein